MRFSLTVTVRYTALGFLFGLIFPLVATLIQAGTGAQPLSWDGIWQAQQTEPLLWIIDTAPIILGILAYLIGRKQFHLEQINHGLEDRILTRTRQLQQQNEELEVEIQERNRTADELRQAKEAAENATKARSEFLSTMSHEIRTPLNAIIGLTGLLAETKLNEEQADFIQTVRMSGESLLSIINDILDYSKVESGKMDLEMQSFELVDPIEDTFDLLASRANEKGLELIYDFQEDIPHHVIGDITRLRQILVNLVGNAVKFTEKGEVFVGVKNLKCENKLHTIEFSIKDTGIGIPKERLDRLFRSFTQVDASTTRKYGGTGLGLAISKRLVELMGGEIRVESEWGAGTTFFFTIQANESEETPKTSLFGKDKLAGKEVLIVDDNDTNLVILAKRCEKWGMKVAQSNHPLKALEMLSNGYRPDLAILDMNMPAMDGVSLAQAIKTNVYSELPLIMLSSGGTPQQKEDRQWFSTWLIKPARKSQLLQAIGKACLDEDKHLSNQCTGIKLDLDNRHKRKLRILLAEDNMVNQKVALRMLKRLGYEADVAGNGLEAVEAANNIAYDLILMDMQMPEKDGLEATTDIRQLPNRADDQPIIIAMTANAQIEDKNRCLASGMDDFLAKPVKLEDLDAGIAKWFYFQPQPKN